MSEKLQKIIALHGIASRRAAEALILAGRVSVNGRTASLGDRADEEADLICVDGAPLQPLSERIYVLFHKPRGIVTSMSDEKGRRDLSGFSQLLGHRVFPVGRLDMDSEGLLLLTDDGVLAQKTAHPSEAIIKSYLVRVRPADPGKIILLSAPIVLEDGEVRSDYVVLVRNDSTSLELLIGIHQGKNRQIRRMCTAVGLEVLRLKRVAEGGLLMGGLAPGSWKQISRKEAEQIFEKKTPEDILKAGV